MKLIRIGPITAAAIGSICTLGTIFALLHFLILPVKTQYDAAHDRFIKANGEASSTGFNTARTDLQNAQRQVQMVKAQWGATQARLMPPFDVSNRVRAMDQLTYELTQNLGPDLEHHLRTYHGKATANFTIPPPPSTPNDVTGQPIAIPLGTVTSRGNLQSVLNQFRSWGNFNRVVVLDNLALHGNSPYIQATYDATVYILPQNDEKLPPLIPQAGGGPAAAAPPPSAADENMNL